MLEASLFLCIVNQPKSLGKVVTRLSLPTFLSTEYRKVPWQEISSLREMWRKSITELLV
jgi:hypothetical protein